MQCWTENRDYCALYRTKRRYNPCYSEIRALRNYKLTALLILSTLLLHVYVAYRLGSVDEVAPARTPESKVCVWSRSLDLIASIG